MRRPASSSLLRSVGLLAQAMMAGSVALLALACGGSTDTGLESTGGAAGQGGAGQGGKAGTAGAAGSTSAGTGGAVTKVCTPGQQVSCPCPGAGDTKGVQVCKSDGSAFDACSGCPGTGGAGGGAGTGSSGTAGATTAGTSGTAGTGTTGGQAGAPQNECGACIDQNCHDQVAACEADSQCGPLYECVVDQCNDATSTAQLGICAFQSCGANQQSGQKITPIAQCAQQKCKGSCAFAGGAGGSAGSGSGGTSSGGTSSGGSAGASDPGAAPGVVNCGDQLSCDTAKDGNCCVSIGLNGPSYTCSKTTCGGGFANISEPCDGPEDCPDGKKICCGQFSAQKQAVACANECKASGGGQQQGGAYQLCHKAGDCAAPDSCQVCDIGQFGISYTARVCGQKCPNQGGNQPGG